MKSRVAKLNLQEEIVLDPMDLHPHPHEVLVKTHLSSICGTDKNYYRGKMSANVYIRNDRAGQFESHDKYPMHLGHEGSGTVVDVGEGVSEFAVGDKVMSFGWFNTMADYFVAPIVPNGHGIVRVPEGMSMNAAALGEPTACAIYAGMQSGVELGDIVLIVGAGFAGQVIAQAVKRMGAAKVIVVDVVDEKLTLAKSLGADTAINAKNEDALHMILEQTGSRGVDVAIEAAGNDTALQLCTDTLKHGGILGIYSWILDPVHLRINRWHDDGFDIRTLALMHRIKMDRDWWIEKTLSNVANGMIVIDPLITNVYDLDEIKIAFETACRDPRAVKVMLKP